jgi:hypothetical protein
MDDWLPNLPGGWGIFWLSIQSLVWSSEPRRDFGLGAILTPCSDQTPRSCGAIS